MKLFLSYSRADFYTAEKLHDELLVAGHLSWLDSYSISPGEPWRTALQHGLAGADAVVVLLSRSSAASANCRWEWDEAAQLCRPVVVLRLDDTEVPESLHPVATINLRYSFRTGAADLLDELEPARAARAPRGRTAHLPVLLPAAAVFMAFSLTMPLLLIAMGAVVPVWLSNEAVDPDERRAVRVVTQVMWLVIGPGALGGLYLITRELVRLRRRRVHPRAVAGVLLVTMWSSWTILSTFAGAGTTVLVLLGLAVVAAVLYRSTELHVRTAVGRAADRRRRRQLTAPDRTGKQPPRASARREVCLHVHQSEVDLQLSITDMLSRAGHVVVLAAAAATHRSDVVVMTDRTPADWLEGTLAGTGRNAVVVAATSVDFAGISERSRRMQWCDFRRRDPASLQALWPRGGKAMDAPPVPEAFDRPRLPAGASWWMLTLAMLTFAATAQAVHLPLDASSGYAEHWREILLTLVAIGAGSYLVGSMLVMRVAPLVVVLALLGVMAGAVAATSEDPGSVLVLAGGGLAMGLRSLTTTRWLPRTGSLTLRPALTASALLAPAAWYRGPRHEARKPGATRAVKAFLLRYTLLPILLGAATGAIGALGLRLIGVLEQDGLLAELGRIVLREG